ncbi:hypothetical protein RJT34_12300 [Clitoria ternatea]|uniref:Uncharacterized protein n=1 Tax=Clitoria ternatea TaxID=43366 RepID=A0AAN9JNH8_CLITE
MIRSVQGWAAKDVDECKTGNHTCISDKDCYNTDGSYKCFCPKGHSGNGTKEEPCHPKNIVTNIIIGVGTRVIFLFVGTTTVYLTYQKRKLIKLREKYFTQNGGSILLHQLSTRKNSSRSTQIFTEEQLKKATNNFDESLIIGKGGYDTEVPLLVYEFVNNGTLSDFIHSERKVNNATWKNHLRIATEAAGALSYLHSAASIPIIHRNVKTANILLDETYTAKVSDFGASRLVPLDQNELPTMVQGIIGYLDPEYMKISQLTEESDVYSFGVVLVELLTGKKPFSFDGPEAERNLAMHFLCCLKQDHLFDVLQVGIWNEENKQENMEVSILAAKCLRLNGEERPTMKEVVIELEGIRVLEKHPWINSDQNLDESQYLLHEASSRIYEHGDSSSQ